MAIEILDTGEQSLPEIADSIRSRQYDKRDTGMALLDLHIADGHDLVTARDRFPSNQEYGRWFQAQDFGFTTQWGTVLMDAARNEPAVRLAFETQVTNGGAGNIKKAVQSLTAGKKKKKKNPATFSTPLYPVMDELLPDTGLVLDPFAGEGGIHQLATPDRQTIGVEIEPEWAAKHPDTLIGNALKLDYRANTFDAICTSPTYGNRMADHHDASDDSERNTYKHRLGRDLDPENSGAMQWGDEYRKFHVKAWKEAKRVLKPGGVFVLNISDHIRDGEHQDVAAWHIHAIVTVGFTVDAIRSVVTQRQKQGANADLRVPVEYVIRFIGG